MGSWRRSVLLAAVLILLCVRGVRAAYEYYGDDDDDDATPRQAAAPEQAPVDDSDDAEPTPEVPLRGGSKFITDPDDPEQRKQAPSAQPNMFFAQLPPFELQYWWTEVVLLSLMVAYAVNYWFGRDRNAAIAKAWVEANNELFERQFAYLGDGKGHLLIKDSASDFIFYASGRVHLKSLTAKLELRRRHDLMSVLLDVFSPAYDTVTFEIVMNERPVNRLVLAVVPKSKAATLRKDAYDLATFTKLVSVPGLPADLAVLSESVDAVESLLTPSLISRLTAHGNLFRGLHYSDQPGIRPTTLREVKEPAPRRLSLTFRLPAADKMRSAAELQAVVMDVIDLFGGVSLSRETRARGEKLRQAAESELMKKMKSEVDEIAEQKKAEKAKAEKERYEKLSPAEKAKYDEQKYKRDLKKNGGMFGRVKVMRA